LKAVSIHGLKFAAELPGNKEFGFEEYTIDKLVNMAQTHRDIVLALLNKDPDTIPTDEEIIIEIMLKRVEEICQHFRDSQQQSKILIKRSKTIVTSEGITTLKGQ
jgi:hypothetical protein